MRDKVLKYIREHQLLRAGDRVGAAVSGGADSVALLRVLLELRRELGIVLAVVHFNHKIRGQDADSDEQFVGSLAQENELPFLCSQEDVPKYAESKGVSLETAGRELRYGYFRSLLGGEVDKIATAHTADDQAETVLMRLLRGAGTKGLAGIHPIRYEEKAVTTKDTKVSTKGHEGTAVVRPMLGVRRAEVEGYLKEIGQAWREDASNRDPKHLRNRVRHALLPLLEKEFNPAIVEVLSEVAELARGDEDYWGWLVEEWLVDAREHGTLGKGWVAKPVLEVLASWPVAMERRIVRALGESWGAHLGFQDVERIRKLVRAPTGKEVEIANGWRARMTIEGLRLEPESVQTEAEYQCMLPVPGEVRVPALGTVLKAFLVPGPASGSGYNPAKAWDPRKLASRLVIRNWRAGDRFWPLHTKSEKKVKELLQERRVPQQERARWPVAESEGTIVWLRGFPPAHDFAAGRESGEAVVIEEVPAGQDT